MQSTKDTNIKRQICRNCSSMACGPWLIFLIVRLPSLLFVQTWFVADEYWQGTEIAHHMAFGYGYQTWEWQHGLRSAFYPAMCGGLYKILAIMKFDYPVMLIELPRFVHALLFSIGDYHIWKLSDKLYNRDAAYWTTVCLVSSWFLEYCAPRTLTSCIEMVLSSVALCHYPWKTRKGSCNTGYLWLMGAACVIRPTAAILFLPLCVEHFWVSCYKLILFIKYILTVVAVLSLTVILDSWYYNHFVIVPWKFAHFNVISGLASHYGTHPWHWYFTQGIPATLTTHLLPFLLAVLYYPTRHKELLPLCIWCLFIYSCLSHKEFRFLLPILPLCLCIAGDFIAYELSSHSKKIDRPVTQRSLFMMIFLMLPNCLALLYLGLIHQRGPLDAINVLRHEIDTHKNPDVLFLMPCHSTPFYSHLHRNVSLRFLTCEPNLKYEENYLDEADIFEKDPISWLQQEYLQNKENDDKLDSKDKLQTERKSTHSLNKPLPTHILLFDVLLEKVESFLTNNNYHLIHKIFNSHVEDGRRSRFIVIYCK